MTKQKLLQQIEILEKKADIYSETDRVQYEIVSKELAELNLEYLDLMLDETSDDESNYYPDELDSDRQKFNERNNDLISEIKRQGW